jgi:hypothetical protein
MSTKLYYLFYIVEFQVAIIYSCCASSVLQPYKISDLVEMMTVSFFADLLMGRAADSGPLHDIFELFR